MLRFSAVRTPSIGPLGHHAAVAHQHGVREARRDLFEVVRDQDDGRGGLVAGKFTQPVDQILAAGQIESGGGFIEEQQFRVRHQGPGDLDALALPLGERGERPVEQRAHAPFVQQGKGAAFSPSSFSYPSRHRPVTP